MKERANTSVAFSHIAMLATLSVVVLFGIIGWRTVALFTHGGGELVASGTPDASGIAHTSYGSVNWQTWPEQASIDDVVNKDSDPDGVSNIANNVAGTLISSYLSLAENGSYTPEEGARVAGEIANTLRASVSYKAYTTADIKTDNNTSYERMLAYRTDLRKALEPLLENPGYELGIFANYVESRDAAYLTQLKDSVNNYKKAVANAAGIVVPKDAAAQHVGILNALSEFGAIVGQLALHADDAFASAALLRTYNESETRMMVSFNTLAKYYTSKPI